MTGLSLCVAGGVKLLTFEMLSGTPFCWRLPDAQPGRETASKRNASRKADFLRIVLGGMPTEMSASFGIQCNP